MKVKIYVLSDSETGNIKLTSMNLQTIFVEKYSLELNGIKMYIMTKIVDVKTNEVETEFNQDLNFNN